MSDPLDYRAIRALQTALAAISIAGGYFFNVASTAVKLDPDHAGSAIVAPDGPRPILMIRLGGNEEWTYEAAKRVKVKMPLLIDWLGDTVPENDESRMLMFFRAACDIEKAIADNLNLGGLANDMKITGRTLDTRVDGVPMWATVAVDVTLQSRLYGAGA